MILGHLRDAVRRHAHLADAGVALAVFAVTMVTTFAGAAHPPEGADSRAMTIATAALACGALAARRRRPLLVLVVSASATEMFLLASGTGSGELILLAPTTALYTVAELAQRRRGLIIGGGAVAALVLTHAMMHPGLLGPENVAFAALGGLGIAAGDSSRNRRAYLAEATRRAERAEREREQDARRRVAEERLRIARDLHDSVGHHLALISVQSDVAGRALDTDAACARDAMSHVKSASRKALEELRDTVSLLRQPGDPVAPTSIPAPGMDALDELFAAARSSGLAIDCEVRGTAVALAPAIDLTAYRVIQESLTNVCKHSARREARLTLGYGRRSLSIIVDDPGSGSTAGSGSIAGSGSTAGSAPAGSEGSADGSEADGSEAGHGIAGMRERVLALGGQFTAGPRPGGAFRVAAALPYQPLAGDHDGKPLASQRPDDQLPALPAARLP